MRHLALLYLLTLTLPLFLGLSVWEARRYGELQREVRRLDVSQEEWIEKNKRLIAEIALLSSAERIEKIAINQLRLSKKLPEEILQIRIESVRRIDG
jgi:cell division protein FtsL